MSKFAKALVLPILLFFRGGTGPTRAEAQQVVEDYPDFRVLCRNTAYSTVVEPHAAVLGDVPTIYRSSPSPQEYRDNKPVAAPKDETKQAAPRTGKQSKAKVLKPSPDSLPDAGIEKPEGGATGVEPSLPEDTKLVGLTTVVLPPDEAPVVPEPVAPAPVVEAPVVPQPDQAPLEDPNKSDDWN